MRNMWRKIFTTAALAFMICLTGLHGVGEVQAAGSSPRFTDHGNGTVTDTKTRLMWTKNANQFRSMFWYAAMSICSSYSLAGNSDWRLPSRGELVALYEAGKGGHPFTGVQSRYYWSSTTLEVTTDKAFEVHMTNGDYGPGSKSGESFVWCVRP